MATNTTTRLVPAALGTVLGVWAHPDDEAFLAAGLTARLTDAGAHVAVVTATRGEHGTADPAAWPPTRLARRRTHELRASLAIVGVTDHAFLGYEDGTLADVPLLDGVSHVAAALDRVRPDTVVTFGPEGLTGHPDHVTVARWVARAVALHPRPVHVLRATTTARFARRWAAVNRRTRAFYRDDLPLATPPDHVALSLSLRGGELDRKLAALAAQASQFGPLAREVGEDVVREWWAEEAFTLAHAHRPTLVPGRTRSTVGIAR
jgi:LmbE family N-acetylglucosaminyl deacetylase